MTTIGQHFDNLRELSAQPTRSKSEKQKALFEKAFFALTVDEYKPTKTDLRWPHWMVLFRHARAWIDANRDREYVELWTESLAMDAGATATKKEVGVYPPMGWFAAMKRLQRLARAQQQTTVPQ